MGWEWISGRNHPIIQAPSCREATTRNCMGLDIWSKPARWIRAPCIEATYLISGVGYRVAASPLNRCFVSKSKFLHARSLWRIVSNRVPCSQKLCSVRFFARAYHTRVLSRYLVSNGVPRSVPKVFLPSETLPAVYWAMGLRVWTLRQRLNPRYFLYQVQHLQVDHNLLTCIVARCEGSRMPCV